MCSAAKLLLLMGIDINFNDFSPIEHTLYRNLSTKPTDGRHILACTVSTCILQGP